MNYQNVCQSSIAVVKEAANFIKSQMGNVEAAQIEDKGVNSLVSYVDKTAEEIMVKGLSEILPESTFITEEDTVENKKSEFYWIIDPLDGTTNFLHSLPFFAVSVALAHHDKIVVGIIYEVTRDECFYTWKGGQAFLNDKPIRVNPNQELIKAMIATGFPYTHMERIDAHIEMIKYLRQRARGIRRFGSAALDLAYVAAGRFDGYFEYGLQPWDVAAGSFLVQQAGGLVSDFKNGDDYIFGEEIVVGNPAIQPILLKCIEDVVL
jgi:myo-inositol-1(or 4)-monophosphatase